MPITQDRLISILAAARNIELGFLRAVKSIEEHAIAVRNGHITAEEAVENIASFCTTALIQDYGECRTIIALEQRHFYKTARANNKMRERQAKARREAGIMPRAKSEHPFGIQPIASDDIYTPAIKFQYAPKSPRFKPRPIPSFSMEQEKSSISEERKRELLEMAERDAEEQNKGKKIIQTKDTTIEVEPDPSGVTEDNEGQMF